MSTKIYGETGVSQIQDEVIDNITFFNGQTVRGSIVPSFDQYLWVRDEKTNVAGGAAVAGWQTRTLNTVQYNSIPSASLVSNNIILPAGTYYARAGAPVLGVDRSNIAIYGVVTEQYYIRGMNVWSGGNASPVMAVATLVGVFTLSATTTIEIRQYCSTINTNTYALGTECVGVNPDVYTEVEIWKIG